MSTFATPAPISATIDLTVGEIRIRASDRDTTVVEIQPTDATNAKDLKLSKQTQVEHDDGQLRVKGPRQGPWQGRHGYGSIDLTIELPAGSQLHCTTQLGDVDCDGRLGDCRIKTGLGHIRLDQADALHLKSGAGDISVERATGRAEVTTGTGEIRLRALDDSAVVKNSNGDSWIGAVAGDLRVKAANGRISIDLAHADVVAKSANGDVRLGEVVRGSIVLETQTGDLEVGIREGTAAWLDVRSSAGKVRNGLETSDAPTPSTETAEVRARTSLGDVVVRRP